MKNPWMSAWLSAANKVAGTARGQMAAEVAKAQKKMVGDWQKGVTAMMTGGKAARPSGKGRKRGK